MSLIDESIAHKKLDLEQSLTLEVCLNSQDMNIKLLHRACTRLMFQVQVRDILMRT